MSQFTKLLRTAADWGDLVESDDQDALHRLETEIQPQLAAMILEAKPWITQAVQSAIAWVLAWIMAWLQDKDNEIETIRKFLETSASKARQSNFFKSDPQSSETTIANT